MVDTDQITKLKGKRNVYLRAMKIIGIDVDLVVNKFEPTDDVVLKLQTLRDAYDKKLVEVLKLDGLILDAYKEDPAGDDELTEILVRTDANNAVIIKIDFYLKKATVPKVPVAMKKEKSSSDDDDIKSRGAVVKLPKMVLEKFDGKAQNWRTFWNRFKTSIDDKDFLSEVDKFNYLLGLLDPEAKECVSGLDLTAENYAEAKKILTDRFGNPQVIIASHMEALVNLPKVKSISDVAKLRKMYDQVEISVRNLKSLEMLPKSYGALLIPVLNEKIPEELRVIISRKFQDRVWDIEEMIECVKLELQARERCSSSVSLSDKGIKEKRSDENLFTTGNFHVEAKGLCVYCRQSHGSAKCSKVTDVKARKNILRRSGRCFKCLNTGHKISVCPSSHKCRKCEVDGHHISICTGKNDENEKKDDSSKEKKVGDTHNSFTDSYNKILLQTAVGEVGCVGNDKYQAVRLMFDSGSQRSYITESLCSRLNLKKIRTENLVIHTFGNTRSESRNVDVVQLKIRARGTRNHDVYIEALSIPVICAPIHNENVDVSSAIKDCKHLKGLQLADVYDGEEKLGVDVLIGLDFYYCMVNRDIRDGLHGPIAVSSMFGWILCGKYDSHKSTGTHTNCSFSMLSMEQPSQDVILSNPVDVYSEADVEEKKSSEILKLFFDVENLGVDEEESWVSDFGQKLKFNGERYSTGLLLKETHEFIPDNYETAKRRLASLVHRFKKDPELFERYDDVITGYKHDGIAELVDEDADNVEAGKVHYLPHMPVIKEDRETTKVRPVFDASSKANKGEPSLNECLYSGPCLLPLIFDILLRFRMGRIGIVADIKQAFLNIEIEEEHRNLLRFLWVNMKDDSVYILRFTRALFGLTCSPFILNATVKSHLMKELANGGDPEVIRKLLKDLYVDDPATNVNNVKEGINFYDKATEYFRNAGFTIHKWKTNDALLNNYINHGDVTESVEMSYADIQFGTSEKYKKVLGVNWDTNSDEMVFDFMSIIQMCEKMKVTKRNVLKVGASFYDPVGWICLLVIQVKLIFKDICLIKVDWDDPLDAEIVSRWWKFFKDLKELGEIRLPRYIHKGVVHGEVEVAELHGFADSSKDAFAAVVYLRVKMSDGRFRVNIVAAKSKVTPSKITSIARLELLGCVLLTKLLGSVQKALEEDYKFNSITCWTDSKDALCWIKGSRKEWKVWIENRVSIIRKANYVWKHVPGKLNPADLATRKEKLVKIITDVWWSGPEYLHNDQFPEEESVQPSDECLKESRVVRKIDDETVVMNNVSGDDAALEISYYKGIHTIVDVEKFHSFHSLCVVTGYILRFIRNLKKCVRNNKDVVEVVPELDNKDAQVIPELDCKDVEVVPELDTEEIENAERVWIKSVQKKFYDEGKLKQLKVSLRLYEDEFSILRSKTRLCEASDIPVEVKFPIVLPNNHAVVRMIIMDAHEEVLHMMEDSTLNKVRQKYWIIKGRSTVNSVVNRCSLCKLWRLRKLKATPLSNLPNYRVCSEYVFQSTGIDFAGPLMVRSDYGEIDDMYKCYILIFTCATSRGVHLEVTPDMGAPTLIRGIQRFLCRKGYPELMVSDNGGSFKAAQLRKFLRRHFIRWKYILELAPWWGGFYERLIRIVKSSLHKVCGHAKLKYDELVTILVEIEHMMNSRPLTYLSEENIEAITPYHLMNGRNLADRGSHVRMYCGNESVNLKNRASYVSSLINQYWKRFYHEYTTELRERMMYDRNVRCESKLTVGDVVLIREEKVKPLHWRKGKIEELVKGRDGAVRGVILKSTTPDGKAIYLKRSVKLITPLEISTVIPDNEPLSTVIPDNESEMISSVIPDNESESLSTVIPDNESESYSIIKSDNESESYSIIKSDNESESISCKKLKKRRAAAVKGEDNRRLQQFMNMMN